MSAENTDENNVDDFDPRLLGLDQSMVEEEASKADLEQFISFKIDAQEYGVNIMSVREIKGWTSVTELPNTPKYVRGVLNLRGTIVPIFDLRCRFHHTLTEATPSHVIIIVAVDTRVMGILVDAVSDILTVDAENVRDVPDVENRGDEKFLDGLITVEEHMVSLLSMERLFDIQELADQISEDQE